MINIVWKERELELWKKRYLQEKELLKRLKAGLMDGLIGEGSERVHLTSQAMIKDGHPIHVILVLGSDDRAQFILCIHKTVPDQ